MKKAKITSSILGIMGIFMISIGLVLQSEESNYNMNYASSIKEVNIQNMAASSNVIVDSLVKEEVQENTAVPVLSEVIMETAPASVIIPPRVEVYEGLTMDELAAKIDRNLGTGYVAGKGYLIASYCIEKGVDPYVAVAILLHETGCRSNCSYLTRVCNNVGGQKGSPGCNGGAYKSFPTLDDGIRGFIDNLHRNYYSKGLTTIEAIAPKYAQSTAWPGKIHYYVDLIRAS